MIRLPYVLETKVPFIDSEHETLLNHLEYLRSTELAWTARQLRLVGAHFAGHFGAEELVAAQAGFPELAAMREDHRRFAVRFRVVAKAWDRNPKTMDGLGRLVDELEEYIAAHAFRLDGTFATWLLHRSPVAR